MTEPKPEKAWCVWHGSVGLMLSTLGKSRKECVESFSTYPDVARALLENCGYRVVRVTITPEEPTDDT